MDPFYFLDLHLDSDDDTDGVYEYCETLHNGDWIIECDKGSVIYKNNKYKRICYDMNSKIITFTAINNTITKQKLSLVTIDTDESREIERAASPPCLHPGDVHILDLLREAQSNS